MSLQRVDNKPCISVCIPMVNSNITGCSSKKDPMQGLKYTPEMRNAQEPTKDIRTTNREQQNVRIETMVIYPSELMMMMVSGSANSPSTFK